MNELLIFSGLNSYCICYLHFKEDDSLLLILYSLYSLYLHFKSKSLRPNIHHSYAYLYSARPHFKKLP